ncbi:MAG TPA: sulfatase-like hydrolase/transferase [Chthoniobacterales bacterium]|nr:sulfatase-like hydrolase/transferase [Chthoniobacterales bacterium]
MKPNILLIMCDQLRADALGCTGNWVKTPNIDRIAGQGVRFANCVTNSPVCLPARISLATGRYPHNTGVWDNCPYELPEGTATWISAVRDAGYRTSVFGKTALHRGGPDLRKFEYKLHSYGLDDVDEIRGPHATVDVICNMTERWKSLGLLDAFRKDMKERGGKNRTLVRPSALPLSEYYDVYVGQRAKEYLHNYKRAEPWFCWVSFAGPHEPWDTPEPFASMYRPEDMPEPIPRPPERPSGPKGELDRRFSESPRGEVRNAKELRASYAGKVSLIDDQVGQIVNEIEARGELDRTIILFTSDHGEMNGDYDLIHKSNFLNPAVRVPFIISTPEIGKSSQAGTVNDTPAELFDAGPSLAEIAGAELNYLQFARSMIPALQKSNTEHRSFAISEFLEEIMYLDRDWKLLVNKKREPYRLFDVKNDPREMNDLIGRSEHESLIKELKGRAAARLKQTA